MDINKHNSKRIVEYNEADDFVVDDSAEEPIIKRFKKKPRTEKVKKTNVQVCVCTGCDQRLL